MEIALRSSVHPPSAALYNEINNGHSATYQFFLYARAHAHRRRRGATTCVFIFVPRSDDRDFSECRRSSNTRYIYRITRIRRGMQGTSTKQRARNDGLIKNSAWRSRRTAKGRRKKKRKKKETRSYRVQFILSISRPASIFAASRARISPRVKFESRNPQPVRDRRRCREEEEETFSLGEIVAEYRARHFALLFAVKDDHRLALRRRRDSVRNFTPERNITNRATTHALSRARRRFPQDPLVSLIRTSLHRRSRDESPPRSSLFIGLRVKWERLRLLFIAPRSSLRPPPILIFSVSLFRREREREKGVGEQNIFPSCARTGARAHRSGPKSFNAVVLSRLIKFPSILRISPVRLNRNSRPRGRREAWRRGDPKGFGSWEEKST